MDAARLRAWWWQRQGLDGSLRGQSPAQVLERVGWARSVGGSNPYLTLFSRAGLSRQEVDPALAREEIFELPSARGCTYVVPQSDFALALRISQGSGDPQDISTAKKYLGVTEEELQRLASAVLNCLDHEPKDPATIKACVGNAARSLGAEGKKRGMTTTLPMVLGRLQTSGEIRRHPVNGRLDQQRYGYVRWHQKPMAISLEEAHVELARRYFSWIGVASEANFQWFSGLSKKAAKAALEPLGLAVVSGDLFALPKDTDEVGGFKTPEDPSYSLVSSLDSLFLLRRDIKGFLEAEDLERHAVGDKGLLQLGHLMDLSNNAIVDRGRIVGLWEYDPGASQVVWFSFIEPNEDMRKAVARTGEYIRDQLGDARSFSLDSPESRKPVLAALGSMQR
ncbi:MAG TPA: crosslink repair DNA glycosylase YcaQ family protein [Fimbriimonas sp.]|nr:crosslink repair DNA glycosylase YcaQ family protein [Fimbriimonas sp.]